MSKSQFDTHLRYGQGLLIQGYKQKGKDLGFLTAKGFADIKAKYQTYDNILFFKNYRNAIFQMLPAGNFQLNDQLHKALIQNQGNQQTPNIKILKARAHSQQVQFCLNIDNKNKNLVCFGNSVIFKHIDSESYISGTIRPSSGSNGAFAVEVSNNLSQSLIFKLMPYRSFQFLGMPIPFDSPIILKNQFNNGYLTFQKLGLGDGDKEKGFNIQKKPIQSDQSYKIPVKTNSQVSQTYQCVTHFVDLSIQKEVPMPWKFVLHFNDVDNDSLIQHDIVYLEHTQNQGVLSMNKGQIILKQLKQPSQHIGLKFYQCLWQIQQHSQQQNPNPDCYILRHLMSGQTLGIHFSSQQSSQQAIPLYPILIDISSGQQKCSFGTIQLKLAKKSGGQINSDSYINVAWGDYILQTIQDQQQNYIGSQQIIRDQIVDNKSMAKLLEREVQFRTRKLKFVRNDAQKHCFVIQQIDDILKKQVLFALSFHSVIINLRQDLKWGAIEAAKKIDYFRMMKVTDKIRQIKDFLKDCSRQQADLQHIFPIQKSQMICKDLGISELLFELLFYMKMNIKEDIFSDKHNERQKFIQLYNTLYEVIRQLIKGNKLFKMHVSKWILFVFEDVINNNESSHLEMLKQLLTQNQFFVQNFVTEKLLTYLTTSMLDHLQSSPIFSQKKYLQILRLFCIIGSTVSTSNQITIYKTFITSLSSQKGSFLNFKLQQVNNQILIKAAIDKNHFKQETFKQFYQSCKKQNQSAWDCFVQYLNLIADMTQGRNKVTQMQLAKQFTLQLLTNIFQNQQLYQAQVPILRILHYLYAQSQTFYPIERKKKIIDYHSLVQGYQPKIISTPSEEKPWQAPFNRVLTVLVRKLNLCGPINPNQFQHNKTVYQLLNFIWESLNLGFWKDKDEVNNILMAVLRILKQQSPILDYQDMKKRSAQNALMIKCKLQCLKIIQLICDYDLDIFVQYLLTTFKGFPMPMKKRGLSSSELNFSLSLKTNNQISLQFIQSIPSQSQIQPLIHSQIDIVDQMVQLSKYQNAQLTSLSLSIIEKVLQTKRNALKHFQGQRFICQEDKLQLVSYIHQVRNTFFMLEDPNLTSINQHSQHDNYFLVYQEGNHNSLMNILYNLSELMKNQNEIHSLDRMPTLESSKCFEYLAGHKLLNFTMERSSTNKTKQNIVFCANLHQKVLAYIFNCKQVPSSIMAQKLLHLCYKFIVALIQNYNQIKVLMVPYIPLLLHHLSQNVGCVDFLKQMYDNNKNMLFNQSLVFPLIKFMCDTINNQDSDSYYKSKCLDFFRYLIYCNGKSLESIQIQIFKIMQDDTYQNIMLKEDDINKLAYLVKQYQTTNANKDKHQIIEMSPQLTYMTTLFQVAASLIDDNNTVNMGKVLKRFPFDLLVSFIKQSGTCWPLKRNIRTLLNRLYYFQPQIQTNLKCIIQQDFLNIISDLNIYIDLKIKPDSKQYENLAFESPVRFSYLESYLYLNLQENFFTMFSLITNQKCYIDLIKALNSDDSKKTSFNFIRICQRFAWIRLFFTQNKNVYSNSMLKFILSQMKFRLNQFKQTIFQAKYGQDQEQMIKKILSGQGIQQFYLQNSQEIKKNIPLSFFVRPLEVQAKVEKIGDHNKLLNKLRNILRREKRDFQSQGQQVTYRMTKLINSIKLSSKAEQFYFKQFQQKVTKYTTSDSIYTYITTIISMNSTNPQALPTSLKSFFLELITFLVQKSNKPIENNKQNQQPKQPQEQLKDQVIENNNQVIGDEPIASDAQEEDNQEVQDGARIPIDRWEPQYWQHNQKEIRKTQNKLKKCHVSKFIVDLLKQNIAQDIKFANSILLCAIAYLLGGNNQTQKSIIQQLSADQQNKVFRNIQSLIEKLGKFILKNISGITTQQKQAAGFCPTTIDNYDFFDVNQRYCCRKNVFQPNSADQYLYQILCITTYRRAFKFLQLLCESNNIEGKNFIREQPGKQRQINFINVATKQLKNLFQDMCKEIKDAPIYLLDFLLQVTQIPVKQNQDALMRSTFFQNLCKMQQDFSVKQKLENRNMKRSRQALDNIYFKSVQIILSNFQGNNQKTFQNLDSKLQPRFLTSILQRKLLSLKIHDRSSLIQHISRHTNKQDSQGKKCTTFSDQIMSSLNIMIIFQKMRDKLGDKSRIKIWYQKFKRLKKEQYQKELQGLLMEKHGDQSSQQYKDQLENMTKSYKCMFQYLEKCIIKIQITDNNNQQQTVYFPKYPVFNSLSGNLRDYVMTEVERNTHRDKIVSLLGFTSGIKQKIEYSFNLQKKQKITQKNMNESYKIASIISILICLYMMIFYDIIVEYQVAEFTSNYYVGLGKFVLSLLQLSFGLIYTFYWYKLKIWYKPERQSRTNGQTQSQQPAEEQQQIEEEQVQVGFLGRIKKKIGFFFSGITSFIGSKIVTLLSKANIEFDNESEQQFYHTGQFFRIAFFVFCSFIGTFFYPILFFVHLLDIFCKIEVLSNIFQAVAVNIKSLLYVSFMGVVFVFIFCTVTFSNYMKNVYSEGQEVGEMCDDVMDCVMSLYVSGAIVQTMESFEIGRFTYDMIYLTFFGLLFGNIVQGIMLDAFANLRESNDQLNDDKSNKCYICNMPRQMMQKKGQSFRDHTLNKHFLWNYVFYIIALQRKSSNDYTGLQYEISQKYNLPDEQMDVSWLPSKGQSEFNIAQETSALTEQVKKGNQELKEKVKGLESKIEDFNKIASQFGN